MEAMSVTFEASIEESPLVVDEPEPLIAIAG